VVVGLVFLSLILTIVHSQQNSCSCTCCIGESCRPISLATLSVSSCTLTTCLERCRATYADCRVSYPNGVLTAQCNNTNIGTQTCRCDCCNTGSSVCTPSYVGLATTYQCQTGSCSIACANQYPTQCVSNQNGQTVGTCIPTTTTTTTTSFPLIINNQCVCSCCNTGSTCSPYYVGTTHASQCSSTTCTQSCQNQYSYMCPTNTNVGQSNGVCSNVTPGSTRCRCNYCVTNVNCQPYELYINGGCSDCDRNCRQVLPCSTNCQITATCLTNGAPMRENFSFFILMSFLTLFFSSSSNMIK